MFKVTAWLPASAGIGGPAAGERTVKRSVIFSHIDAPGLGQRELCALQLDLMVNTVT